MIEVKIPRVGVALCAVSDYSSTVSVRFRKEICVNISLLTIS